MTDYKLHISRKTAVFNFFRRIFCIPLFENLLLSLQSKGFPLISKLIPPNYLYPSGSFRLTNHKGVVLRVDISNVVDHFLYWNLVTDDYASILEKIKKASIIFDIGANIGSTSLYFSKLNPEAKIHSFEPNGKTFNRLLDNIQLNNCSIISMYNLGFGEVKSEVKLYEVDEHNPGMNRILPDNINFPFTIIKIDTIDDFCRLNTIDKIDFIKIDVEGYEYAVLAGGINIIKNSKPLIFLELDDNNLRDNNRSAQELIMLLEKMNYKEIQRADTREKISSNYNFKNCHFDIIAF
jgi:FkbM family methyltransferase